MNMKRLLPLTIALMLASAPGFAQDDEIVIQSQTVPMGATTMVNGVAYIMTAAGLVLLASVLANEGGSSTTGTN